MAQFLDLYRKCFITSGKNPSHGRLSTVGLRAFNPLSLFLAGEQGAWYDPSDFQPNWRRNLLTWSEDFSNGAWVKTNATITVNAAIAPDGTLTADKIEATSNAPSTHQDIVVNASTVTLSAYFKKGNSTNNVNVLLIRSQTTGTNLLAARVNLDTGAITYLAGSSGALAESTGDGWWKLTLTTACTFGNTIRANVLGGYSALVGDFSYIWGAQLEQSSSASTYQKITDGIQDYYTVQPQPVLFQDSAGTTPVTAVEQPVGLMLDKSKGLALGAELVTNGGPFTNTTGWVVRANCTLAVVGNELIGTGTTSGSPYRFYYQTATVIGTTYKVTVNISSLAGTGDLLGVYATVGASLITALNIPTTGIYIIYFTAATTTSYIEFGDVNASTPKYTGISNISVKQIAGNHAFQGDLTTGAAAKRPMLSARTNLLTKTEDFSDGVWSKNAGTSAVGGFLSPKGTSNAYTVTATLNGYVTQNTTVALGDNTLTFTYSIYLKAGTVTACRATLYSQTGGANTYVDVDLTTGNKSSGGNWTNTPSVSDFGNGWYKVSFITTPSAASNGNAGVVVYNLNNAGTFQVWGADLRPTNSGALLPPYQRVNTASDYDTVGFPLYLKANGTSSAMSTNSIDFTGTDKMTVVTGVRKLSDAANANVFEMGNTLPAGGFNLYAPNTVSSPSYSSYANAGTVSLINSSSSYPAPIANVISMLLNTSAASPNQHLLRVNSIGSGTQSATLSGNFTNIPLYLFSRAGTSSFLNGQFYGAIIRGAQSDTASVTQTENYMATKTGISF